MTPHARPASVIVEAPARLHFGMLDLRGDLGRRYGGIGASIAHPSLVLEARPNETLATTGTDAERALRFARRYVQRRASTVPALIHVVRSIPAHVGLGSGTQLALSVGRALAELSRHSVLTGELADLVGRGIRSAVGTWTFAHGGFVLEGGKRPDDPGAAPLLARLPMPSAWRCVLALPPVTAGLTGDEERQAFARLPAPPAHEVEHVAHLVLMSLLPALYDGDIRTFGAALTEVQCINGRWFEAVQGGTFAPGPSTTLVRAFTEWGAAGIGQSSWGPAVYAIVPDEASAEQLAERARALVGPDVAITMTAFDNVGARVSTPSHRERE